MRWAGTFCFCIVCALSANFLFTTSSFASYRKATGVIVDVSKSSACDFNGYREAIHRIAVSMNANEVLIIWTAGESYRKVIEVQSPRQAGLNYIHLRLWRRTVWEKDLEPVLAEVKPTHQWTDLLSPLKEVVGVLRETDAREKWIVILSDGFISLRDVDFEYGNYEPEKLVNELKPLIPDFSGMNIEFCGMGGSSRKLKLSELIRREKLKERAKKFWEKFFKFGNARSFHLSPLSTCGTAVGRSRK